MTELKKLGDSESPIWLNTATISINGKEQEIIPAFHSRNRIIPSSTRDKELIKQIESSKLLDCRFNFVDAQLFIDAGIGLYDIQGTVIPNELPGNSPKVLVYLDDAVSFWQWGIRDIIPATILTFSSVQEAFQAIGITDLFSRSLSNVESNGLAGAVSGNSIYNDIYTFANTFKVPQNTAMLYLKVRKVTRRVSKIVAAGIAVDEEPVQERSYEDAEKLYQAIAKASHDIKLAKSRYFITTINSFNDTFSLDEILEILNNISYDEGEQMRLSGCNDKEDCIKSVLRPHFKKLRMANSKPDNAA